MPLVDLASAPQGQQPQPQQTAAPTNAPQSGLIDLPTEDNHLINLPPQTTATPGPQQSGSAQVRANAAGEQKSAPPTVVDATAHLSPNKPAAHNPLRDQAGAISQHLDNVAQQQPKANPLVDFNKLAGALGHTIQGAVVGTEEALWKGALHSVENVNNVLDTAGRGALQVANDITEPWANYQQQMKAQGKGNVMDRSIMDDAAATIRNVGEYMWHSPQHMAKVLNAAQDPRQTQILTDAFEHHVSAISGLPDPNNFPRLAKIITDTVVQGGTNPASYVPIADAWKWMTGFAKLATDTKVGSAIVDAMGHTAGLPALSIAAKQMHGVMNTTMQNAQKALQFATRTRPDLDQHWTDPGRLVVMGVQNAADHVSLEMEKAHDALITQHKGVTDNLKIWDAPPREHQQEIYREMYMYGTERDAQVAEKAGRLFGWRPNDADKAARAQGLFDFNGSAKGLPKFMTWVPPKGASEAESRSLVWWKKNTGLIDMSDVYHNGADAEHMLETMKPADVAKMTQLSQTDLLKNRYTLLRGMVRRALISKNLAHAVEADPSLMHTDPLGDIREAADETEEGMHGGDWEHEQLKQWMQKNVEDRQPSLQIGGKINWGGKEFRIQDALVNVSRMWKNSLLGNVLPHGLRNVGVVTALRGGLGVAAKGLKYAVLGMPQQLQDEMKGAGAWTEFWRETPEMFKNLMVRSGVGAGIGAASGAMKPTDPRDPYSQMKQIGEGAVLGGAFGAAMPKMGRLMDRFENSYRAAYFEDLKKKLNPQSAADMFAIGGKVANDLGGYQHTSLLVKILQGLGGTFMAYRGSTVPRAFIDGLINKTGLVSNSLNAEQNASGLLPANSSDHNPQDYHQHVRTLGAIDEAPRILNPGPFAGSAASVGPMVHTAGKMMFGDTEYPVTTGEIGYDALNMIEGGSAAQTLSPWLDPYPNTSGMPLWGQEILRAFGGYVDAPSYAKEKITTRRFEHAKNR